jgi:hypothetical protein
MDYQCRPQRLWKALTDPRSLADWMGPVTGRAKGGMRFGAVACELLAAEPVSRLVWRWRDPREGRTFVISWRIEPIVTGCRLRFEQREATAAEAGIAVGLPAALDDASGDASFTAGAKPPRGENAAAGDGCDDAGGILPGANPDEVQVYGACELTVAA